MKSKVIAGVLGIFLGGLGVHKFYLGQIIQGIIYLLFCWTLIPAFIGLAEGLWFLIMDDNKFNNKYNPEIIDEDVIRKLKGLSNYDNNEPTTTEISSNQTSSSGKVTNKYIVNTFTAIDFETATSARNSICQVGIAKVESGKITENFSIKIQPPNNKYSAINTRIHGLSALDTADSSTFPEVWQEIKPYIENTLVVAHNTDFDFDCMRQTLDFYELAQPDYTGDCTYKRTGKKLADLCDAFGINLIDHHNAEHDAKACAEVYLKLISDVQPDYSNVTNNNKKNKTSSNGYNARISGDLLKPDLENADPNSPFYDRKVVFTGKLLDIDRIEAAIIVKKMGADIDTNITKRTKFVVMGEKPGPAKVNKIETLKEEGHEIKIISESELLEMIKDYK